MKVEATRILLKVNEIARSNNILNQQQIEQLSANFFFRKKSNLRNQNGDYLNIQLLTWPKFIVKMFYETNKTAGEFEEVTKWI